MKRYKIVKPFRFFLFVFTIVMTLTFAVISISGASRIEAASMDTYKMVEVRMNDTLWDIVDRYCDSRIDNRVLVNEICEINGIEPGDIQPGDSIIVPVVV